MGSIIMRRMWRGGFDNYWIMKMRCISFFIVMLCAVSAFAEKKMTLRNTDTGESFEVTVPDGMRMYQYNANWLDSILYLLERARYGEPWAYEALGDCCRYGKGGVKESIINALVYYDKAGKDIEKMGLQAAEETPKDHLGLVYRLIDRIEKEDRDGMLCLLDTMNQVNYRESDVLRDFLNDTVTLTLPKTLHRDVMSEEMSVDKAIFIMAGCKLRNWVPGTFNGGDALVSAIASKFLYLSEKFAVEFLSEVHEEMDPIELAEKRKKAIGYLQLADKEAMLSREGAGILYDHYVAEVEAGRMAFDAEELERLAIVGGLGDSEAFIFTDK